MKHTNIKNPLLEAMHNINSYTTPEYLALNKAIRSLQNTDIDMPALKLARETFNTPEISALRQAKKILENIRPATLGAFQANPHPMTKHRKIPPETHQDPNHLVTSVKEIGSKVKNTRKAMGMTQKTFADLAGVGRRFISELEGGKPTLEFDRVLKVCAAAGIDIFAITRGSI